MKIKGVKNYQDFLNLYKVVAEGKTKKIWDLDYLGKTLIEDAVAMEFKDDIIVGDGEKKDTIEKKGIIDCLTNHNIFQFLNNQGIKTHYVGPMYNRISIVKKLDKKINLEVVGRRVATGSILKHTSMQEGDTLKPLYVQFYYKDDSLHNPLLDPVFISQVLNPKTKYLFNEMRATTSAVFCALEEAFAKFKLQLIDIKLEFGMVGEELVVIDEITASNFRLWPYADGVEKINFNEPNVLNQLDPKGRLDKDNYRMGTDELSQIADKFSIVAGITGKF